MKDGYFLVLGFFSIYVDSKVFDNIVNGIKEGLSKNFFIQVKIILILKDEVIVEVIIKLVDVFLFLDCIEDRVKDYYSKNFGVSYEDVVKYVF